MARRRTTDTTELTLSASVTGVGDHHYLPFEVPADCNRVRVRLQAPPTARLGLGLFDQRGAHHGSRGFRGVTGPEGAELVVASHEASPGVTPGTIRPGTWTVVLPVLDAPRDTDVHVHVTLTHGAQEPETPWSADLGVVRDEPGWYRGDLHCHTTASSDARAREQSLSVADWGGICRELGLDFAAMTDHNVVSQNRELADAAGDDLLLLAGEEMTNWWHGHATVSGLRGGDEWVDWRQRPSGLRLGDHEVRIAATMEAVHAADAYVSAAHPMLAHVCWQFLDEARRDPAACPDGMEVWSAEASIDDEAALRAWDRLLVAGRRVTANGGSDLHAIGQPGQVPGTPTTVVWADRLSRAALVDGLRRGRAFVTRTPDGVGLDLTGQSADGTTPMGGTVAGRLGAEIEVWATVHGAAGMRLEWIADGRRQRIDPITSDMQTLRLPVRLGRHAYVRAEVRGDPAMPDGDPVQARTDLEALSNPVHLTAH